MIDGVFRAVIRQSALGTVFDHFDHSGVKQLQNYRIANGDVGERLAPGPRADESPEFA
jgi:hypothetical protein